MSELGNHPNNNDEFLVKTVVDGKSWEVLWDPEGYEGAHQGEAFGLDHPVFWELHKGPQGISIRHKEDGRTIGLTDSIIDKNEVVTLPPSGGEPRHVSVQLKRLRKIRPAFVPDLNAYRNIGPADHYASAGIRDLLIAFSRVEKGYKAMVEGVPVFSLTVVSTGFQLSVFQRNVRFKILGQKSRTVPVGNAIHLTIAEVHGGAFIWGSYWWRINKVGKPEILDSQDFADEEKIQDSIGVNTLGKIVAGLFLAFILISRSQYYLQMFQDSHKPKVIQAEVELKKPKIIPIEIAKKPEPPKPKPVEVVKKEPPKKKERPKKVAKKEPPKKKEAPKKIVKREVPKKRPVIAKAPPKPLPLPKHPVPPKRVAKAPSKPAPPAPAHPQRKAPPVIARAPDPAIQRAQQKAQEKAALAKSLNFLSSAPSKNVGAFATVPGAAVSAKYRDLGAGAVSGTTKGGASALNKLADSNVGGDGTIATRGARSVAGTGLAGSHGKGLNEVQGKVSLSALYGDGSGEELASAAGGAGVNVSGPGKISDAAIEKTLAKYLQKFQYCYEKALLSDSTLAGTIQMQWTIQVGGAVFDPRVVRSAMNNRGLHTCLTGVLSKIVFPSPTGGAVVVKKPFAFQSTTL